jgi:hypothetical protein
MYFTMFHFHLLFLAAGAFEPWAPLCPLLVRQLDTTRQQNFGPLDPDALRNCVSAKKKKKKKIETFVR